MRGLRVFAGVFKVVIGVAYKNRDFEAIAGVLYKLSTGFGPFGLRQDIAIEPFYLGFIGLPSCRLRGWLDVADDGNDLPEEPPTDDHFG